MAVRAVIKQQALMPHQQAEQVLLGLQDSRQEITRNMITIGLCVEKTKGTCNM